MAEEEREIAIPLEYCFPEDLQDRYATNIVVQHTKHEFIVSFFEVRSPIFLGSPEQVKAQVEKTTTVRADCVARVIVAATRMPEFVEALQKNLEHYLDIYKQDQDQEE